ncbi:hypothetical protein CAPTEDRAFT_229058 [Capitella teleta]|uniref:Zinc transporter ZIP3 n=1 Tax=Capitella teleta TaxID=283909 RepID=X2B1B2_CAPTE|nr:hypothetical protein CAPTEDRAFT_229058 [Capitella teleta]|eukprot:ELU00263.1 hypothetical protein CAPTEDRAFT_229058 [Capitella teleta]
MELVLVLQIVFIFVIFIINLVFVLLPLKIIPRDPSRLSGSKAKRIISFCNCFSGGVFLGVCFLQLTPYVNAKLKKVFLQTDTDLKFCLPTTQCIIILGFFLTQLAEQIVRKVQRSDKSHAVPPPKVESKVDEELIDLHAGHGHSHLPVMHGDDFGLHCVLLLLALSLHSFFEGIAIGLQDQAPKLLNLFLGVAVHECLVAFAVGISLAQQRLRLSTVLKISLFFSSTIPIGMVIGLLLGTAHESLGGQLSSAIVQAIAAGTFYHVIFLEILPTELNAPQDSLLKILFLFVGFSVITAMSFSMSDHHH